MKFYNQEIRYKKRLHALNLQELINEADEELSIKNTFKNSLRNMIKYDNSSIVDILNTDIIFCLIFSDDVLLLVNEYFKILSLSLSF